MSPRHIRNDRTRRHRLGNDPALLRLAPPAATDDAPNFGAPLNDLRVVTDVDHDVHTIRDPWRIAIMHASISFIYVGSEHRLQTERAAAKSCVVAEGVELETNILCAPGKPAGGSRCKFCTLKI
jgi:hypothetical protein